MKTPSLDRLRETWLNLYFSVSPNFADKLVAETEKQANECDELDRNICEANAQYMKAWRNGNRYAYYRNVQLVIDPAQQVDILVRAKP